MIPDRHWAERWWTWTSDRPVELSHRASGFTVTPVLYAASADRATLLKPGPEISFGRRPAGDKDVAFETSVAGTDLSWRYHLSGGAAALAWNAIRHGEWGLRFWVALCLSGPVGTQFVYDRENGILTGSAGGRQIMVTSGKKPLLVTAHDDVGGLVREFDERGYFYLGSRSDEGEVMALRFNLEEAPSMTVHVHVDGEPIPGEIPAMPPEPEEGVARALAAMHDVMAWNHVWDPVNGRPYTALSRFWNTKKFGGFGVWLNDVLYNAWMWGFFDTDRARENLDAVFAWQTEAGNFPCLVTGNDAWLDRTQPPVASFVVWSLYQRLGDLDVLERYADGLLRNARWWQTRRKLGDTGLLCFGTSLEAGDGLYKGTKLAAKDESTMDNSPLHDPVPFDEKTGLLLAADVGLNSLAALDAEILAGILRDLGDDGNAKEMQAWSDSLKIRIDDWLWDDARGVYANRMLDGAFVPSIAPTSFYPLVAGIGTDAQVDRMIAGYLDDPDKFGGEYGLPSVTRDDPAYGDNVYWRGRIWGPLNFWVHRGLQRMGRQREATALAEKSWRVFEQGWRYRLCGENYNAENGAIHDQADTDGFYAWGALLAAINALDGTDES
ncbi:MAG: trehalase family glycosidase [Rhodospirillales bacterium]